MKLQDLNLIEAVQKGTYAGVKFDSDTVLAIRRYITENNIPHSVTPSKIHTTLLYSRKFLPNYTPDGKVEPSMVGVPRKLVVWKTQSDNDSPTANCLVLQYSCPALVAKHKQLMKEHGATYDYDTYHPHVTLSYDIGDLDIKTLPKFGDTVDKLMIVEEYKEVLSLTWAKGACETE